MLSSTFRLKRNDFDLLLKSGKTRSYPLFSLRFVAFTRKAVAVVVAKKVAPLSVDRSRGRRRVYGALHRVWALFPSRTAVALFLRKEALIASPKELESALKEVLHKLS